MRRPRKNKNKKILLSLIWTTVILIIAQIVDPNFYEKYLGSKNAQIIENPNRIATPLRDEGKIRVCIWNLHSYLDSYRIIDGVSQKAPKPESEKLKIVQTLKRINPDVLGVVEIGGKPNLLEFAKILSQNGLNYPYMAVSNNSAEYPQTAILSKLPIKNILNLGKEPFQYFGEETNSYRGILVADFAANNKNWKFGVVHLKSRFGSKKRDKDFAMFRKNETTKIAKNLSKFISKNEAIIIGGDFNDEPSDAAILVLQNAGLKLLKQQDANGNPFSYYWAKKNESRQFDFFLISNAMSPMIEQANVLPIIQGASDHAPVYSDINFGGSF